MKLSIEQILPNRWHLEIDYGPSAPRSIADFATLAEAVAAVAETAAKIEPVATLPDNSDGHVSEGNGAHIRPPAEATPATVQSEA